MIRLGKAMSVFLLITMIAVIPASCRRRSGQLIEMEEDFETSDSKEGDFEFPSQTLMETSPKPEQLNCMSDPHRCKEVCGETKHLAFSATFCSPATGSCICDCRDKLSKDCTQTPFTPCFQGCVKANPNPDAFLYRGGNCPLTQNGTTVFQCACECTVRDDYQEINDVF